MRSAFNSVLRFVMSLMGMYLMLFIILVAGLIISIPSWAIGIIAFVAVVLFLLRGVFP